MKKEIIKLNYQRFSIGAGDLTDTSYPLGIEFKDGVYVEDIQFIKDPFVAASPESWLEIVMNQKLQHDGFDLSPGNDDIIKINYDTLQHMVERLEFKQYFPYFNIRITRNSGSDILGFHVMLRVKGKYESKAIKPGIFKRPNKIMRNHRG